MIKIKVDRCVSAYDHRPLYAQYLQEARPLETHARTLLKSVTAILAPINCRYHYGREAIFQAQHPKMEIPIQDWPGDTGTKHLTVEHLSRRSTLVIFPERSLVRWVSE